MIVVDSVIWIDHVSRPIEQLSQLMALRAALMHPYVLGEIALGTLRERERFFEGWTRPAAAADRRA